MAGSETESRPTVRIFETWDRPSADIVVGLLEANGVTCLVRGTADTTHFGIGPPGFWRVYGRASDEARAQEILDAEIGREEESRIEQRWVSPSRFPPTLRLTGSPSLCSHASIIAHR